MLIPTGSTPLIHRPRGSRFCRMTDQGPFSGRGEMGQSFGSRSEPLRHEKPIYVPSPLVVLIPNLRASVSENPRQRWLINRCMKFFTVTPGIRNALLFRGPKGVSLFSFCPGGNCVKYLSLLPYITIQGPVNNGYFIFREPACNSQGVIMQPYFHFHEYIWFVSASRRESGGVFAGVIAIGPTVITVKSKTENPVDTTDPVISPEEITKPVVSCPQSEPGPPFQN